MTLPWYNSNVTFCVQIFGNKIVNFSVVPCFSENSEETNGTVISCEEKFEIQDNFFFFGIFKGNSRKIGSFYSYYVEFLTSGTLEIGKLYFDTTIFVAVIGSEENVQKICF